jgi:hypothetical protein
MAHAFEQMNGVAGRRPEIELEFGLIVEGADCSSDCPVQDSFLLMGNDESCHSFYPECKAMQSAFCFVSSVFYL